MIYCFNCPNFKEEKCTQKECKFPIFPSKEYIEKQKGKGNIYSAKILEMSELNQNALWAETMVLLTDVMGTNIYGNSKKPTKEMAYKARELRNLFLSGITNVDFIRKRKRIIFY